MGHGSSENVTWAIHPGYKNRHVSPLKSSHCSAAVSLTNRPIYSRSEGHSQHRKNYFLLIWTFWLPASLALFSKVWYWVKISVPSVSGFSIQSCMLVAHQPTEKHQWLTTGSIFKNLINYILKECLNIFKYNIHSTREQSCTDNYLQK